MRTTPRFRHLIAVVASAGLLAAMPAPAAAQGFWGAAKDFLARATAGDIDRPLTERQRAEIIAVLEAAPSHGLADYGVSETSSDEALERAVVSYARAMRGGRMAGKFTGDWHLRPAHYDAAAAFAEARRRNRVDDWLADLPPPQADYQGLREALALYRELEAAGGWKTLSVPKKPLKVGAKGPAVLALRQRLGIEYAGPAPEGDRSVFDAALAEALKAEQARLGVAVTGQLDRATVAALNVPVSARVDAIEANLERWRWLPHALPGERIEVNVPAYRVNLLRGGETALSMKAIVGKPETPTPMFHDVVRSLVFNPPWNVPQRIARESILPRAKRDKTYLVRNDYFITDDGRVVQRAGPKSALGKIKFDLTNPFAIYLHDTPSKELFEETSRAFSNGCIRIEKPQELAALLLERERGWDETALQNALAEADTSSADLRRQTVVYVVYRTAFMEDGKVQFRDDIYGWDEELKERLAPI